MIGTKKSLKDKKYREDATENDEIDLKDCLNF